MAICQYRFFCNSVTESGIPCPREVSESVFEWLFGVVERAPVSDKDIIRKDGETHVSCSQVPFALRAKLDCYARDVYCGGCLSRHGCMCERYRLLYKLNVVQVAEDVIRS